MSKIETKPLPEVYSEPSRTSKVVLFAKIVNGFHLLTIFAKGSILDVRMGSEYASTSYYETKIQKAEKMRNRSKQDKNYILRNFKNINLRFPRFLFEKLFKFTTYHEKKTLNMTCYIKHIKFR